nr:MAG TPA: FMN-binding domain protein [Caudoviricetes sp.]
MVQFHPLVLAPMVHVTTSYNKLQQVTNQTHYKKEGGY